MGGGGKSQTSTQQVSIPPEVLARYNAVNARAEDVAKQGFQQYGTTAEAFVAPLTQSQQQGIAQSQQYSQAAQPYFGAATNQLLQAQQQGQAGLGAAYPFMQQGLQAGQQLGGEAYGAYQALPQIFMPSMQQAQQGIQQGLGAGQTLLGGATGYTLAGAQPITPQQFSGQAVNQYMSPFMSNVVGQTMAAQAQQNAQQRRALTGQAIQAGAFGGDRAGIAQANLAYQQNLANQQTIANLLQGGYGQALGAFQQQQGVNLAAEQANRAALAQTGQGLAGLGQQAYGMGTGAAQQQAALGQALAGLYGQQAAGLGGLGQQQFGQGMTAAQQQAQLAQQGYGMGAGTAQALAGLGQGAQAAGLQGAQAMMGAGQIQQQTEQAGKQALYNQFLQQQGYPFQVAQFLANIAMGTGALSGSTTTTTQPSPFFSDRKLKENIRKIGETKDGLPIYKFRYKGENKDQTHIGYMADEVEKKHPDAVGEYGGAKYVDYNKVNARESMGGAVKDGGIGRAAYALGGNSPIDPNDIQALIAQQRQMYGPHGMGGLYGGSAQGMPAGGKAQIPSGGLHVPKLVTAGSLPRQQQSGMEQAMASAEKAQAYAEKIFGKVDPKTGKRVGGLDDQWTSAKNWFTGEGQSKERSDLDKESLKTGLYAEGGLVPRQHFKFGGEDMYKTEQSYVPEEVLESDEKTPELMTAKGGTGGGGGGGKSGLGTALGAAGTLASFIPGVGPAIGAGMKLASAFMADGGIVPRDGYQEGGAKDEESAFRRALNRTLQFEGGYTVDTGGPTMMGISSKANPDVDLQRVKEDPEYKASIYRERYWNPIGAGSMDPRMQGVAFDTAVNLGVGRTQQLLEQAGGDPQKLLALRQQHYDRLVADQPDVYGQYAKGWANRVRALGGEEAEAGGLGRGQQVAAAQGQQPASMIDTATEKAKGLGDYLTSSRFLSPLGAGILAMASSPSIRPGGAILTGLGAGLAAMQPSEIAEERKKALQIGNVGSSMELAGKAFYKDQNGNVRVVLKDGRNLSYGDWLDAGEPETAAGAIGAAEAHKFAAQQGDVRASQRLSTGTTTAPAGAGAGKAQPGGEPAAAPSGAPATAPTTAPAAPAKAEPGAQFNIGLSPEAQAAANDELKRLRAMPEVQRDAEVVTNKKLQQRAIDNRDAAYAMTPELNNLAMPLVGLAAGEKITPGVFAPVLANAARGIDYIIKQARLPDEYLVGGKAVNQYELSKKAEVALSAAKAAGADMRAIRSLEEFNKAIASAGQDAGTARSILARTIVEKQKALEEGIFTQKYATSNKQYVVGQGAADAFRKQMPDEMYAKQEAAIKDLMTKKLNNKEGTPWLAYLLNQGTDKELQKQNWVKLVNEYYGFDIARYFLNR